LPITGVPQARASTTLTLTPAPLNNGDITANELAIRLYGLLTNPRYSMFLKLFIKLLKSSGRPAPIMEIVISFDI
jgi:hypothetical protein